jgi:uncharacterized linocin/CFP29 family protein
MTRYGRDDIWDASTWAEVDKAVTEEAARVRVGRRVFATEDVSAADGSLASWVSIARTERNTGGLYASEAAVAPFAEIAVPFWLSHAQAEAEPRHHLGRTLARRAAKTLALVEDLLLFGGSGAAGELSAMASSGQVKIANSDQFFFEFKSKKRPVPTYVSRRGIAREAGKREAPKLLDETVLAEEVSNAISDLTTNGWPDPYVLILGNELFVNAHKRIVSAHTETPADRLRHRLKHLLGSQALGAKEGILVSLAGGTTTIYGPTDPTTAFLGQDLTAAGTSYVFRVAERFQFAIREPDAIVLLQGT